MKDFNLSKQARHTLIAPGLCRQEKEREMRVVGLSLIALVACSSAPSTTDGNGTTKPKGSEGGFGNGSFDTDGGAPSSSADGCAAAARLVYVLSIENDLYSFTPNTVTFTKVGRLDCPSSGIPNSMAIDRSGVAWVNYTSGDLLKVSTTDASCTKTAYVPNQGDITTFGMAFTTNEAGSTDETLYISGLTSKAGGGKGFGKIDLKTFKLTVIGDYSGILAGEGAELTGTGDGRLFGFFTTSPYATLAEIDKSKGATSKDKSLEGVTTGLAWAFSFWGGDFWFYTSDGVNASQVTQLKSSGSGELAVAKADVGGFRISGAGVSTCAPTTPPK
jgi:hypothetical protein